MKKTYYLLLLIVLFLGSCSEKNEFTKLEESPVSFNSIVVNKPLTKITGSNWDKNDKIGVFAIKNNQILQKSNIVENYDNLPFLTNGNGIFNAERNSIYYPKDGSSMDFVSYYPYNPNVENYKYPIDVRQQIDVIYSNNLKGVSKVNAPTKNTLQFKRVLSKIVFNISPKTTGSLEGLVVKIEGAKTKASLSLADGMLDIDGSSVSAITPKVVGDSSSKKVSAILLPSTLANSIKVQFSIGTTVNYTWMIPHDLKAGTVYNYDIKLDKLAATVTHTKDYMEVPVYTSSLNAPNSYKSRHMVGDYNWLNGYGGSTGVPVRNYTILYDINNHIPYWVAYPMHPTYLRSGNRTDDWAYDPIIPQKYQPTILNNSWGNSTYNRGHMLASADRSATKAINRTTFYASNMVPQNSKMNGGTWNNLEGKVRYWCKQTQQYDTLYVVTGSILPTTPEQIKYTTDKHGKNVAIPKYLYKALLRKEKSTNKYHSIAFKMENRNTGISYTSSVTSVEEIEKETGFTFFPNLPSSQASQVKKEKSMTYWN